MLQKVRKNKFKFKNPHYITRQNAKSELFKVQFMQINFIRIKSQSLKTISKKYINHKSFNLGKCLIYI